MRDRTERLARSVRGHLHAGEEVLAGVALSLPGTVAAQLSAGARASDGAPVFADDDKLAASIESARQLGVGKGVHFFLVLTDARLLLVRRSLFGRPKEVVLSSPLAEVAGLRISKQGHAVFVSFEDGRELRLETPKAFKFLPPVYESLPAILKDALAAQQ